MTECFTCLWISEGIRRSPGALTWSLWQLLWQRLPAVTQICYFPLIFPRCKGHNNFSYRPAAKSIWSCQSLCAHVPPHAGPPLRSCAPIYVAVRYHYLYSRSVILQCTLKWLPESYKSAFIPTLYTFWKSFSGSNLFPSISWNKIL